MATEKRLIDANALVASIKQKFYWMAEAVINTIEITPTVDAVEVVRCKDCESFDPIKKRCDHPHLDFDVECYDHWINVKPEDFCSYGERRTDGR